MSIVIGQFPPELLAALRTAHKNRTVFRVDKLQVLDTFSRAGNPALISGTKAILTLDLSNGHLIDLAVTLPLDNAEAKFVKGLLQGELLTQEQQLMVGSWWASELLVAVIARNPEAATVALRPNERLSNCDFIMFSSTPKGNQFEVKGRIGARDTSSLANALAHGSEPGFEWPDTKVLPSRNDLQLIDAPEEGYLKYLGYTVGEKGPAAPRRRDILTQAFKSELPRGYTAYDKAEWGAPSSCARLKKIAYSIANFAKLKKRADLRRERRREGPSYKEAIHDWEQDLNWLKEEYYSECRVKFTWPDTIVS